MGDHCTYLQGMCKVGNGSRLTCDRGAHAFLHPVHYSLHHRHVVGIGILHQRPQWSGGRPQYFYFPLPTPPHRVQRTPPHQEMVHSTGGQNLYLLCGYGFTPRPPKIHPIHQIGRRQQATGGVGSFCTVFPGNVKGNPATHDIERC